MERVIGTSEGEEKGPLFICFGGMHGNEPAGIKALEIIFQMLEIEPMRNPTFKFKGRFIGLVGNKQAYQEGKRFIKKDLNRQWLSENMTRILKSRPNHLSPEEVEIQEILFLIKKEIKEYQPEEVVVLDIHTTSAFGGIFTIVNDDPDSLNIGSQLHAPVIKGLIRGLKGTTLHFFDDKNFPVKTTAVTFEAGQHKEPQAVNRSVAAIVNCLRSIGCVDADDVENIHDQMLLDYSKNLPKVTELLYTYAIEEGEEFELFPGFKNFQTIEKGQVLGKNKFGDIIARESGLMLMPLYQKQGEDGFFMVKEVV